MKTQYLRPETDAIHFELEERFLDASLGSSKGENISGSKNVYGWDWGD